MPTRRPGSPRCSRRSPTRCGCGCSPSSRRTPTSEACVCDLNDAFDLSQPTISHHLKVLHEVGLLDRSKRGVWVYYRVHAEALADLSALLGGVTA